MSNSSFQHILIIGPAMLPTSGGNSSRAYLASTSSSEIPWKGLVHIVISEIADPNANKCRVEFIALGKGSTKVKIWSHFISRLEEINEEGIDFIDLKDNIERLAKHKLNGREIRNVVTTVRQYARWEWQQPKGKQIQLDFRMMEEMIETAGEFDKYIENLNGGYSYDELAEVDGLRLGDDA
ncbi:hypothetical protein F5Y10DRAFT_271227 [Nemania abortiva]|nr:hypothetical protein F5Y10DRAFT_271227 [Nemania abortiva]